MRAGVIGLGAIGGNIARHVASAGVATTVFDVDPAAVSACTEAGARAAGSPREVAANADVVGIVVRDDAQVRSVVLGDDGVLAGAARGSLVAIHSTIFPDTVRDLAEEAHARGVGVIDAALTGSEQVARAGELTFMVGGEAADVERARAYLEPPSRAIVHTGALTTGMATKLCVNLMGYIQFVSGFEANLLATHSGVDLARFDEVTTSNGALTPNIRAYLGLARAPGQRDDAATQRFLSGITDLAEKDLSIALAYARRLGITLPAAALTQQLMARVYGVVDEKKR